MEKTPKMMISIFAMTMFSLCVFGIFGCSSSQDAAGQAAVQAMSDEELDILSSQGEHEDEFPPPSESQDRVGQAYLSPALMKSISDKKLKELAKAELQKRLSGKVPPISDSIVTPDIGQPPLLTPSNIKYINDIFDLTQTDDICDPFKLTKNGSVHCGPFAASNTLVWLAKFGGKPKLAPDGAAQYTKVSQCGVVAVISGDNYMKTNSEQGTGPGRFAYGIAKYLKDMGYGYTMIEYEGWRPLTIKEDSAKITEKRQAPNVALLNKGVDYGFNGGAWINNGWYKYDAASKTYTRVGGHWVTVVGYGKDDKGNLDENMIIIHDPAPRADPAPASEYVKLEKITEGTLKGDFTGLPVSAVGYYKMTGGMHMKSTADVAIIDGIVVLKI